MSGVKVELTCVLLALVLTGAVYPAPKNIIFGNEDLEEQVSDFNGDEHDLIGSNAVFPNGLKKNPMLTLPNGVEVQFSKIVALAGDFYGVPKQPIINTSAIAQNIDQERRRERFLAAYQTLGVQEGKQIREELNKLVNMIEEDHVAKNFGKRLHSHAEWDRVTGGAWVGGLPVVPGRMLNLAAENYDHFQPQAVEAYLVGHQLAIEKAREASRETNAENKTRKLMEAYSMDAFACHYLTDSFSGGHIRTPRVEIHDMVTPSKLGDYLSKFMHDEDCKYGVSVKNKKGDRWIAYGDSYLLSKANEYNLRLCNEAVQASVTQVGEAYDNPTKEIYPNVVTDIIPSVDPEAVNNAPLFQMKNGQLVRRMNVNDLQDRKTKLNWWSGTSTIQLLKDAQKKNSVLPVGL